MKKHTLKLRFYLFLKITVIAFFVGVFLKSFVITAYKVETRSMLDTILQDEYILVNRTSYIYSGPERGDVVVFKYPLQDNSLNPAKYLYEIYLKLKGFDIPIRRYLIKRVIGLPGEEISIRDSIIYIEGKRIDEHYEYSSPVDDYGPVKIPEDYYFVMGDNREESRDSREWGFLKRNLLVGRAFLIYYSIIPDECPTPACGGKPIELKEGGSEDGETYYKCPICGEKWRDYRDFRDYSGVDILRSVRWSRIGTLVI